MPKLIDLTGKTYNHLTVVRRVASRGVHSYWLCRCDCGKEVEIQGQAIRTGNNKACGCRVGSATHRMSKTKVYIAWQSMKDRCYNMNNQAYACYGGRGITVCDEWRLSFEAFYEYIGDPPTKDHSIDKVDNNGDYEPGNVRWATKLEQASNRRKP